jgi:hypothetical protein
MVGDFVGGLGGVWHLEALVGSKLRWAGRVSSCLYRNMRLETSILTRSTYTCVTSTVVMCQLSNGSLGKGS